MSNQINGPLVCAICGRLATACRITDGNDHVTVPVSRSRSAPPNATGTPLCDLCGEPMPPGEEMFRYHGYSGPCPKNATKP